jgi:hypothetical protein
MRHRLANRLCTCLGNRELVPTFLGLRSHLPLSGKQSCQPNQKCTRTPQNAVKPCNIFCIRYAMSAKVDAGTLNIHVSNASLANTAQQRMHFETIHLLVYRLDASQRSHMPLSGASACFKCLVVARDLQRPNF